MEQFGNAIEVVVRLLLSTDSKRLRFRGLHLLAITLASFLLFVTASIAQPANDIAVPGEYIVKYNEQKLQQLRLQIPELTQYSDEQVKDALTSLMRAETKEPLPLVGADSIKATTAQDIDVGTAVDLLDSELADYISPNFIRTADRTPNDPSYSSLWGLNQANDIDINAPEAWDSFGDDQAKDIIVGVVDTGVDYTHPDLAANMWTNPSELNGQPGVDDDGNGVVDDIYGYNAISNSGNPMDDNNHGTHCSGTIGGVGNNGVGVTGVAWKVKIMALKFLSSSGSGTDADAIKAINYAVNMRNRGGKLRVLSNSWGGSGQNPAMQQAIQAANDAGILFVAAAGNNSSNNDTTPNYPSNYNVPNVVSVAAIDSLGNRAVFSNYGANTVTLAAPGLNIYSTVRGGGYATFSGTSMATPHVSGVAALIYAKWPQFLPQDVKEMMSSTVKRISGLNGLMQAPGIVNAQSAIADPSNYPPDLLSIANVEISPVGRTKTIPIPALDRENDPLTYSASVPLTGAQAAAAQLDRLYDFAGYYPALDNYYHLGEKEIDSLGGFRRFFIFADGSVYELTYPTYSYRGTVDPIYYQFPDLLVNASTVAPPATVTVVPGTPYELRINLAPTATGSFPVNVSVSDGHRVDTEWFIVTVKKPESCV
ncbi:MAG: S8 family peptidase [Bdellovibrionota bacterium]